MKLSDNQFYAVLAVVVLAILVIAGATYRDIANMFMLFLGLI